MAILSVRFDAKMLKREFFHVHYFSKECHKNTVTSSGKRRNYYDFFLFHFHVNKLVELLVLIQNNNCNVTYMRRVILRNQEECKRSK